LGSIDACFKMLSAGEKAEFIIDADKFFSRTLLVKLPHFIKSGSDMKVDIAMIEIQTGNEYIKEKDAFLKWMDDFNEYEKEIP